jgi:DNA-binding winged helix-turn-helix (wHTH) protein
MSNIPYPEHPLTYRQELLAPLSKKILAGECVAIIGASSMAKSNLVRFLLRKDVRQHYFGVGNGCFLLSLVNANRLEQADYAGYELMLVSIIESAEDYEIPSQTIQQLEGLHRELILSKDRLLGLRYLERAIKMLVSKHGWRVAFLIDEFDVFYKSADVHFLRCLRALRDEYKYRLVFISFSRLHLERLRPHEEVEDFYELFNRSYLGLQPYLLEDAQRVVLQLEARKGLKLDELTRKFLLKACGGHPGLLVASYDVITSSEHPIQLSIDALSQSIEVIVECKKLWDGLDLDEQWALIRLNMGVTDPDDITALKLLELKGLINSDPEGQQVFSPLFSHYIDIIARRDAYEIYLDECTSSVWISGATVKDLTPLEYSLFKHLYTHRGQVCSRDQILQVLYPEQFVGQDGPDLQDNRVDNLIKRLRSKIEPIPSKQNLIKTMRGYGYLLSAPKEDH